MIARFALCALAASAAVSVGSADAAPPPELVLQVSRPAARARAAAAGRYAIRWLGGSQLTLWDHASGMLLGPLEPPRGAGVDCAISPTGRYLACGAGQAIAVRDIDTGAQRRIGPTRRPVVDVWFSRDGSRIFAAEVLDPTGTPSQHAVSAWSFSSGSRLYELATPVSGPGFLGHGNFVVGATADELAWITSDAIRMFRRDQQIEEIDIPAELRGGVTLAISDDGKRAASRHVRARGDRRDAVLAYWDWSRRTIERTVELIEPRWKWLAPVYDTIAISGDGKHVAVRVPRTSVRLYRFGAESPTAEIAGEPDLLAFTGDEQVVIGTGLRNAATGALVIPAIPELPSWSTELAIQGTRVLVARGEVVSAWDLDTLERSWSQPGAIPSGRPWRVALSEDGARFTVDDQRVLRDVDTRTGAISERPRPRRSRRRGVADQALSPDGAWEVSVAIGSPVAELRAAGDEAVVRRYKLASAPIGEAFRWTGHGFVSRAGGVLQLWRPDRDDPVATHRISPRPTAYLHLAVSPDGDTIGVTTVDGPIRLIDAATGAVVATAPLEGLGHVGSLAVSNDREWAALEEGGTPVAINLARGAWVKLVELGDDWVIADRRGVFTASAGGGRLLATVRGRRGFLVDQLALSNNRPAELMRALGVGSDEARAFYQRAHQRRLRRAGVRPDAAADPFTGAPEARFGAVRKLGDELEVGLQLEARRGLLRYNIDVNGVPVFGVAGKPASGARLAVTERIPLAAGANRVELRVVDAAGVEGLRPVRLVEAARSPRRDLYFLGFGVSSYANPAYNLGYARKDVIDVAAALRLLDDQFAEIHTRVYVDAAVTPAAIKAAREFFAAAGVDDLVVLMIAGHGVHSTGADPRYYFVTHGTDVARLAETAAPFESIEALVDGIAARRKLVLMDTCESGERDPQAVAAAAAAADSRGLAPRTARALVRARPATAADPRRYLLERDRFLFNGILRRSGAVVLSSSRGAELSYEARELANGVFTQAVLEALAGGTADRDRDSRLSVAELRAYVASDVAVFTGGAQNPTIDRDNLYADISLPVAPGAKAIAARTGEDDAPYVLSSPPPAPAPSAIAPAARSPRGCGCQGSPTGAAGGLGLLLIGLALASLLRVAANFSDASRRARRALSRLLPPRRGGRCGKPRS